MSRTSLSEKILLMTEGVLLDTIVGIDFF